MARDAGERFLVKEVTRGKNEKIDRKELIAMLRVQCVKSLDERIETVETKIGTIETQLEKITQELREIKQFLQRLLKKA